MGGSNGSRQFIAELAEIGDIDASSRASRRAKNRQPRAAAQVFWMS
jgi:hypothetical protein